MEIPRTNQDQIHFSEMIRKNKKTRKIPIIGYGNPLDESQKRFLAQKGISRYLPRPLKFSMMLQIIQDFLKTLGKTLESGAGDKTSEKEEDIKLILDPDTLPTKKIGLMVKHISGMTAFPFTVAKVLRLTESEKSGAGDLGKVIEADPVISTSILKVSNTVFFASLNRRINSIKDAIVRIGFRETKRIVMTMSVMVIFDKDKNSFGFNRMDFWYHSLATALIAERIAKYMGDVNGDEAFLSGLLHDFGVLLLNEFFPTIFSKVLESTSDKGGRFTESQKSVMKITMYDVVKELFTAWKIPDSIISAMDCHSLPWNESKHPGSPEEKLTLCTAMANIIAKTLCLGRVCDEYVMPIDNALFAIARMPAGLSRDFHENLAHDLGMYRKFLNLQEPQVEVQREKREIGVFCPGTPLFVPAEDYLKAQGHSVTRIAPADSYIENYDRKFDAIFVWGEPETSPATVKPLLRLSPIPRDEAGDGQKLKFAPVCAILYKDSPLATADQTGVSRLYNELDLRVLDSTLMQMLNGEIVPLQQFKPAAPAQQQGDAALETDTVDAESHLITPPP
jgi:HD-like signal output (HDOD) protein